MTMPVINELSTMAKFIVAQLVSDTEWNTLYPGARFFEDVIPEGISVENPAAMFILESNDPHIQSFGFVGSTTDLYQIKAVVEGADYTLLEKPANIISRVFDWSKQLDVLAGRPKTQQVWQDPDDPTVCLMIMGLVKRKNVKFPTFVNGINYCHLGGKYEVQYYQIELPEFSDAIGFLVITMSTTLVRPTDKEYRYFIDTNNGDVSLNLFSAIGGKGEYRVINVGPNNVLISLANQDTILGSTEIVVSIPAYGSVGFTDFSTNEWSLTMVFIPGQNTIDAIVSVAATVTLTMPVGNTAYKCDTTGAAVAITLPASDGSGKRLTFDWIAGANALTFVLNGSDVYDATFPSLVVGSAVTLRSIAVNKWAIE